MRAQQVVRGDRGLVGAAVAWRQHAVHVAAIGDDPRLVDRRPQRYAVVQRLGDDAEVVGEPMRDVRVEPAAAVVERGRQVPVVERGHRRDAGGEQLIDQALVEAQAGSVDASAALGQHAAPGDAEAVGGEAEILHQRDIVAHAAVVVAGDGAAVAVVDAPGRARKAIPDAGASAIGQRRAFDLVGRRGAAPEEAGRKRVGHGNASPRPRPRFESNGRRTLGSAEKGCQCCGPSRGEDQRQDSSGELSLPHPASRSAATASAAATP